MSKRPTVLMILDGYGLNDRKEANAIAEANTPVMDKLMAEYPYSRIPSEESARVRSKSKTKYLYLLIINSFSNSKGNPLRIALYFIQL